ncbi:hypothetical protein HII36_03120 [Nonomuraea sp. NN258]|uniref:hypothetical protein n=1 Tax=Nonomuraea antri TaxID=2730852 RepID=UPI001569CAA5|nr:hypothetical protein [Nonomuraea antri]NRQ30831.1 hypothetical protein [Nonomuraea antri]
MRKLLAATALAGSIATGLVLAPAAQAAQATQTVTATQAQAGQSAPKFHYYSYKDQHSSFKGYWYKKNKRYYFGGDLFQRHHKRDYYSYVWVKWYDGSGFHQTYYKTKGHVHFGDKQFKRDLDFRVCWGKQPTQGCGGWKDVF